MSRKLDSACPDRVRYTPSTNTPTEPSNERLTPLVPMPRIWMSPLLAAKAADRKVILGDRASMLAMFATLAVSRSAPVAAVTAMGTS